MKRVTLIIVATIAFLLLPGCGGGGGTGSGGGGGNQSPEDGIWAGNYICFDHPDQLYPMPQGYHAFWVKFEVKNRQIVKATSEMKYSHPDGYIATATGCISGNFWVGGGPYIERLDINPVPGHPKHKLTRFVGNSAQNMQTNGSNPPNTMSGNLLMDEYGDDAPLGSVAVTCSIELTRQ